MTRTGFYPVVSNAYAGFGFPAEAPVRFEFPNAMGLEDSDLTPIEKNIDNIVAGLTKWQPGITSMGFFPAPPVVIDGDDYATVFAETNYQFMKNLWGDGLPIVPPTDARVNWILTGSDLDPSSVISKVLPKGGVATVHSLAVNLAMAGGRPEYLPVLMAIVKAIAHPKFELQNISPSSNSNYLAVIVNGPAAKDIRLNSGYGLIGPDSMHPSGGCIGRALAFVLQNLGGAIPGIGAMELYGGLRHTNAVFAEDEAGLPEGWASMGTERGYAKDENSVTVLAVSSAVNVTVMISDMKDVERATIGYLHRIASNMKAANLNTWVNECDHKSPGFAPGLLMFPRTWAQQWANRGWDKQKLKAWLRENTRIPLEEFERWGMASHARVTGEASETSPGYLALTTDQIRIVVAGGAQAAHAYWMEVGKNTELASESYTLPAKWKNLLMEAEADLGPMPPQ